MSKQLNDQPAQHEYRLATARVLLVAGIAALVILPVAVWWSVMSYQFAVEKYQTCLQTARGDPAWCDQHARPGFLAWYPSLFTAFIAFEGVVYLIMASKSRLIVGEDGVGFTDGFVWVRGAWKDAAITSQQGFMGSAEVITLRVSDFQAPPWLGWSYPHAARRRIPISAFSRNWRATQIGEDIRRFAPQLLVGETAARQPA